MVYRGYAGLVKGGGYVVSRSHYRACTCEGLSTAIRRLKIDSGQWGPSSVAVDSFGPGWHFIEL